MIVGAANNIAAEAFGVDNCIGFQLPVAMLQAVAGAATVSGIVLVTDMERGYFDKLLLTPTPRVALSLSRVSADAVRSVVVATAVLIIGLIVGTGMESGIGGAVVLVLMMAVFGAGYSGIGLAIALRTGNAQAAQLGLLIFFPLLFLSTAFAPKEVFEPWLETLATYNPITYVLQGTRDLVLDGWNVESLLQASAAILGLGVVTVGASLLALRDRTS